MPFKTITHLSRRATAACVSALLFSVCVGQLHAAEIEIFPGDSFEAAVENLNPGDVLTVHEGEYSGTGRISIGVRGTANEPVIIQGAPGEQRPHITRPAGAVAQNTINIEGATYLTIRNLEISSNGGDGITMAGNPSYITLEDLDIHDISVGVNFRSSMDNIVVRRNHIYRTNDTGEGMYVGCNYATCVVRDSLIENNWIHDTFNATQGDGIEIKRGSHSNIIRDNVIHDTNWPCIILYGTEGNPRNIVEGNVMWNCGEAGIQVAADSVIRNNIILDSPNDGLLSLSHQGVVPGNLEIVHNTIVTGGTCLRIGSWDGREGIVFSNNAVYCRSGSASIGGLGGVTIEGNVLEPALSGLPQSGYTTGRSEALDLLDAANRSVYPTSDSALLGAGSAAHAVNNDFNGTARTAGVDAGAYTWTGASNPGWTVTTGFKDAAAPGPTLVLDASPASVDYQGNATLSWTSNNASSCVASGDWSGNQPLSGQADTGALESDSQYTLTCQNANGDSVSETVSVTVGSAPDPAPTVSLSASASSVQVNDAATLTWSSSNADSCTASGAWSGSQAVSGSASTGQLAADSTFVLTCTGSGGSASSSVTVTVVAAPAPPPPDPDPPADPESDEGGGSPSLPLLLILLATCLRRIRIAI